MALSLAPRSLEEGLGELPSLLFRVHAGPDTHHVGVVVLAGQGSSLGAPRQCGAATLDLVGGDLLTVARSSDDDAERARIGNNGLRTRNAHGGIVVQLVVGRGSVIDDFVPGLGQLRHEETFQLKTCMISSNMYAHGHHPNAYPWPLAHSGSSICAHNSRSEARSVRMLERMTTTDIHLARVLDGADPTVRIQDDLFRAISGTWLKNHEIPADLSSDGSFMALVIEAEKHVREIIEELAATNPETGEPQQIASFYNSWMDTERINAAGVDPLAADLASIDAATSKDELAAALGHLLSTGVGTFFGIDVDTDLNDPERYTTFFYQSGIGLPDEAYYREPQFTEVLDKYREFLPSFLALGYGLSEDVATAQAKVVFHLEKSIAGTHMNVVDSRDTDKINNPMSWNAFVDSAPGFNWTSIMQAAGFSRENLAEIIVLNPDALRASAAIWDEATLEDLKIYSRWRVLRSRATFLTEAIDKASFDFYGRVLSGTTQQRARWKRGVQLVNSSLGEAIGKIYVERHFPPEHKAKMTALVEDLLEAYRQSIRAIEWMGEETKLRALEKVDSFVTKIGYPEKWLDYSSLTIGDDLVENVRQISHFEFQRGIDKLGKPMDRSEWFMSPQTVNAYYNPVWNEIVFPAAILQFPFFDPERDDAFNYGGIGAVIGHEIGHGFDDQGSKYDASGALHNWWTDIDRSEFEQRTGALVAQYDVYIPEQLGLDSPHHVQGALTLGENIGDLGGLSIGLKAYGLALERAGLSLDTAPVIDGYTGIQRVLISYARIWQEKRRTEMLQTLIATDPHSPAEFRCNGVVKNVDAFAEAFDVQEGDALYLPPEERVRIW